MPKEPTAKKASARKGKAETSKKDPNAPKKALSPYMFFTQEWREKIKEENPGISFGEVAKRLGAKWKQMSDDEKEPYIQKHQADKKRAEEDKEAYESKGSKSAAAATSDDDD